MHSCHVVWRCCGSGGAALEDGGCSSDWVAIVMGRCRGRQVALMIKNWSTICRIPVTLSSRGSGTAPIGCQVRGSSLCRGLREAGLQGLKRRRVPCLLVLPTRARRDRLLWKELWGKTGFVLLARCTAWMLSAAFNTPRQPPSRPPASHGKSEAPSRHA